MLFRPDNRPPGDLIRGRGAQSRPANPHLRTNLEADLEQVAGDDEYLAELGKPPTVYLSDESQSLVTENRSPDINFRYSVNPYRGCSHGCSYCYARPTHEYLGMNAGLDFETRVLVKHRAPQLFRRWLARPCWAPEPIAFSGVTDCYQPAEREFRLTRGCLEVALECRQPVMVITKNALVVRDLDLLGELANWRLAKVAVSVTTLDDALARDMEPRTSSPPARLRAIGELAAAGVPTMVMVAPVIPGLNDSEIPAILEAAAEAGARGASYVLLRLPTTVEPVFMDWLRRARPNFTSRVEHHVRSTRGGQMYQSRFGLRGRGSGPMAEQIAQAFGVFAKRYGLAGETAPLDCSLFQPPSSGPGQRMMF
ncbi:MAG: PA0069 family radical SAM protein [Planctomycetota bacterium]